MNIFEFSDYKQYLLAILGNKGARTGSKSKIAKAIGCQPSFVSHVLNGPVNFSLEQVERLGRYLNLEGDALYYFILLAQKQRAGTYTLEEFYEEKISEVRNRNLVIEKRLKHGQLRKSLMPKYYQNWTIAAVHMAVDLEDLSDGESIAKYLGVSIKVVRKALEFLEQNGLIVKSGKSYKAGPTHIHLGANSSFVTNHHQNWRTRAQSALAEVKPKDLHYSGVYTIARKDIDKVRETLILALESISKCVKDSKSQEVFALNFDWFHLKK